MISRLSGTILETHPGLLILDVQGVGYEVQVPVSSTWTEQGEGIHLFTHLVVREDAHTLFGFGTMEARDTFRLIISVTGIGPRIAMNLLGHLTPEEFRLAIATADIKRLVRIPGLGRKSTERLVMELKDRVGSVALPSSPDTETADGDAFRDAMAALEALGYKPPEAERRIKAARAMMGTEAGPDQLIKAGLSC